MLCIVVFQCLKLLHSFNLSRSLYIHFIFHVCVLEATMERPFEYVADINDKKDLWKLAVKVKDKWTMVKDGREHLELVIADAKVVKSFY